MKDYSLFLYVLRKGLWNDLPPDVFGSTWGSIERPKFSDWKFLCTMAARHAVTGLFFDGCSCLSHDWKIPRQELFQLFGLSQKIKYSNQEQNAVVCRCVGLLNSHGILNVLLKGQGVALCYANPSTRQCGDIDFYVASKQKEALDVLRPYSDEGLLHDDGKHLSFRMQGTEVELHRYTDKMIGRKRNKAFQLWTIQELLQTPQKIKINGTVVKVPSANYNVFYVFYHLYRHFMSSGVGLRQFCDLARLIYTQYDLINQTLLKEKLKEYGLCRPWDLVMGILVFDLGLENEKAIFCSGDDKNARRQMLEIVMQEGNFGRYGTMNGRPSGLWSGKLYYLVHLTRRHANIVYILPRNTIEYYMNYIVSGIQGLLFNFCNLSKGQL